MKVLCCESGQKIETCFRRDLIDDAAPRASAGRYSGTKHGRLCMNLKCDVGSMTNGSSTGITVRDRSLGKFWQQLWTSVIQGERRQVKLFVDAGHFRRGRAHRGSILRKHGFLCHVFRCYGDVPQILYEVHNFGTCWAKVRNMLVRRLMQL